ncbi:DUF86 domain-containing protein [Patescibacteria group bacterium]|nr:DUF86 domain-containing protein [Patescibacteria group bacterium]MBU4512360.1 DUF86 domain-containing protein [Patescibacteria group bacterium]MCG2692786.1 DUF86 domain-containing protein [Candidatus Parcubacteria bacterium]
MELNLDIEKVKTLMNDIEKSIDILKKYQDLSLAEFQKNQTAIDQVAYRLQRAIEGMISLGTHILAKTPGEGIQKDYGSIFLSLSKLGIIPDDRAVVFRKMASYRNRLVHDYYHVTEEELHDKMQNNLGDFEEFLGYVSDYLEKIKYEKK